MYEEKIKELIEKYIRVEKLYDPLKDNDFSRGQAFACARILEDLFH